MEHIQHRRSIVKAITYRIIATVILAILSWIITGNIAETSAITISFTIVAIFLYYVHERVWADIKWGRR